MRWDVVVWWKQWNGIAFVRLHVVTQGDAGAFAKHLKVYIGAVIVYLLLLV